MYMWYVGILAALSIRCTWSSVSCGRLWRAWKLGKCCGLCMKTLALWRRSWRSCSPASETRVRLWLNCFLGLHILSNVFACVNDITSSFLWCSSYMVCIAMCVCVCVCVCLLAFYYFYLHRYLSIFCERWFLQFMNIVSLVTLFLSKFRYMILL